MSLAAALALLLGPTQPKIELIGIYNPINGWFWDRNGKSGRPFFDERVRKDLVRSIESERALREGRILRLVFFKSDNRMMATSKEMVWNSGHAPGIDGPGLDRSKIRCIEVQVAPSTKKLDLETTMAFGKAKTVVEFTYRNGRITPREGMELRPRVVDIPPGYELSPPHTGIRKIQPGYIQNRMGRFAVIYNESPLKGGSIGHRAWDFSGKHLAFSMLSGVAGSHDTVVYEGRAKTLARFRTEWQQTITVPFANVSMNPSRRK